MAAALDVLIPTLRTLRGRLRVQHLAEQRGQALCSLCDFWCMTKWTVNNKPACRKCAADVEHRRLADILMRRGRARTMWREHAARAKETKR